MNMTENEFATPDEMLDPDAEIIAEENGIMESLKDHVRYAEAGQDGSERRKALLDGARKCVDVFASCIAQH